MKDTKITYSLIPSVRTKGDTTSPMSVLPAVPVLLPNHNGVRTLGIIDSGAAFSCISEKLLKEGGFKSERPDRSIVVNTPGGVSNFRIITTDLIIADPNYEPWLRIHGVSFAVTPNSQWASDAAAIILGYSGCLEHLTVEFDFPHRVVSISAPAEFNLKHRKNAELLKPSRLREAEIMLRLGSYDSAVVMAASAIEELARTILPSAGEMRVSLIAQLRSNLPIALQSALESLMQSRNTAVHGVSHKLTKSDAEKVIGMPRKSFFTCRKFRLVRRTVGTAYPQFSATFAN